MDELNLITHALAPGVASAVWLALGMAVVSFIKALPTLRQTQVDANRFERTDFLARIKVLEERHDTSETNAVAERERHSLDITALREALTAERTRHTAAMQTMRDEHLAEMRVLRHELANERQKFMLLITLLKVRPDKIIENISEIERIAADHDAAIALEKGSMAGARLAGKKP